MPAEQRRWERLERGLSLLERTREVTPAGLDDFCAPSKVQSASIQRENVGECQGAIKQHEVPAGHRAA